MAVDNTGSDVASASGVVVSRGVDVRRIVTGGGRVSCGAGGTVPVNRVQALVNASRAYAMIILKRIVFMITSHLLCSAIAFVHSGAVKKTMPPSAKRLVVSAVGEIVAVISELLWSGKYSWRVRVYE